MRHAQQFQVIAKNLPRINSMQAGSIVKREPLLGNQHIEDHPILNKIGSHGIRVGVCKP